MRWIPSFVLTRLRHRPGRWLLVAAGVAAATALPVLAQGSAQLVAGRAVGYGIGQLDPGQRSVTVSQPGVAVPAEKLTAADAAVRAQLARLSATPPRLQVLFQPLADATGQVFVLAGTDDLAGAARITAGRAPQHCTPTDCEVVVIGDGTPTLPDSLGLHIVGRAVRTDPYLLSGEFRPQGDVPVLLGDGVAAVQRLDSLVLFHRSFGWIAPLDLTLVRHLGVDAYLERSADVAVQLVRTGVVGLTLTAPDDVLRETYQRAQLSARRFALLSGSATALLLGFAAVGAIGLRRDHATLVELLRRRGAGRAAVGTLTAIESAVPVLLGTVLGAAVGALVAGVRGRAVGLSVADGASGALRAAGWSIAVGALVAGLVVALVRAWPDTVRTATAWRAVELTILAGLAVVGLALARGAVTTTALSSSTDPLLLALPVLLVICGGLLVGRVWPALATVLTRLLPGTGPRRRPTPSPPDHSTPTDGPKRRGRTGRAGTALLGVRLGVLGGVRRPLRPVATAAFLAAATGIVVFAAGYSATLQAGAADQAAFAVPLDVTVGTGPALVNPLDAASLADFTALVPGGSVHPALRTTAAVRINAAQSVTTDVLGIDPAALASVTNWDRTVGGGDPGSAARALAGTEPPLAGTPVPADATTITIAVSGDADFIDYTAWLRPADGRDISVDLVPGPAGLTGELPPRARGATLFALSLALDPHFNTLQQHKLGEGYTDTAIRAGTLTFGPARLGGPTGGAVGGGTTGGGGTVAGWRDWASTVADTTATDAAFTVRYQFTGGRIVLRPRPAAEPGPLPVLADPQTAAAAAHGQLSLGTELGSAVPAQVVGVLPRFPTTGEHFVVADVRALADRLDVLDPGTGSVQELWLRAAPGQSGALAARLAAPPFDRLAVADRAQLRHELATEPLATGASSLLRTGALIGIAVAVVAVLLLVVAQWRDEGAELYAWESDGVPPGTLRLSLFARACAVVLVGVPGGLVIGVVLSAITTRLVAVTAVGGTPVPPLALAVGPGFVAAVVGAGVLLGLAAAAVVAGSVLRGPLPTRPEEVSA